MFCQNEIRFSWIARPPGRKQKSILQNEIRFRGSGRAFQRKQKSLRRNDFSLLQNIIMFCCCQNHLVAANSYVNPSIFGKPCAHQLGQWGQIESRRDPAERARRVLEIAASDDLPKIEQMWPYLGELRVSWGQAFVSCRFATN